MGQSFSEVGDVQVQIDIIRGLNTGVREKPGNDW